MDFEKINNKDVEQLFKAILSLNTSGECHVFFNDLCTEKEIKSLAQRLAVAIMLREGQTYMAIQDETGASTATKSRVKNCLSYGNDGFHLTLDRIKSQ